MKKIGLGKDKKKALLMLILAAALGALAIGAFIALVVVDVKKITAPAALPALQIEKVKVRDLPPMRVVFPDKTAEGGEEEKTAEAGEEMAEEVATADRVAKRAEGRRGLPFAPSPKALVPSLKSLTGRTKCEAEGLNEAVKMRAVQSRLMVAALSCKGARRRYNDFARGYAAQMATGGEAVLAYFKCVSGGAKKKAVARLDKMVTQLANVAAGENSAAHNEFCAVADEIFEVLEAGADGSGSGFGAGGGAGASGDEEAAKDEAITKVLRQHSFVPNGFIKGF